jgi:hypothetical protein
MSEQRDPEYATFRDLVDAVERVDHKLDVHKDEIGKRLGRIEKGLVLVGALSLLHPSLPVKGATLLEGVVHSIHL